MSDLDRGEKHPRLLSAAIALALTLTIQIYTALAATAISVLAPVVGRELSVAPKLVGVYTGLVYAGAMAASLAAGGFIDRYGPIRVSQACVLLCAAGLALMATATTFPAVLIVTLVATPIVIGLGYGPITPASSQILVRTTSSARMALTFSIKQTGVPGGAALAGALLPVAALSLGWHSALLLLGAIGIVVAVASQIARAELDAGRTVARTFSMKSYFAPLRRIAKMPILLELTVTGFVYAALQVSLMSFLVIYLTESLGFSLVTAGLALTAANLGGIFGRIVWGAIADLYVPPRALLGMIGVAAGCCAWTTIAFGAAWPLALIFLVCVVFGSTAIGWNGVQISEIARNAPAGEVGTIAGAAGSITFGGVMVGPPAFALVSALTGGYRVGFAMFGTASLACGAWLLARHKR
jgi:MFS family permease